MEHDLRWAEEIYHLRRLAARLRSLAMNQPSIAGQLRQIADEADDRADAMTAPRLRPRTP